MPNQRFEHGTGGKKQWSEATVLSKVDAPPTGFTPQAYSLVFEPGFTGLKRIHRKDPVGGKPSGSLATHVFFLNQDLPFAHGKA